MERLCAAVVAARPDAILVQEHERPYLVEIVCDQSVFAVYALPSEGVPVLIGMRELKVMDVLLGCASGRCLIGKKMLQLRSTPKGHLVMDIVKHAFSEDPQGPSQQAKRKPTTSAGTSTTRPSASTTTSSARWTKPTYRWVPKRKPMQAALPQKSVTFAPPHVQYYHSYMLDFQWDSEAVCLSEQAVDSVQVSEAEVQKQASFLGISKDEARYLLLGNEQQRLPTFPISSESLRTWQRAAARASPPRWRGRSRRQFARAAEEMQKQRPKGRGKGRGARDKTEYDTTRTQGPDDRDPRSKNTQWPCFGQHDMTNRYGRWNECSQCAYRLSYTPAKVPRRSSRRPIFPRIPWRRSNDFAEKAGRQRA